jgi:16S rRNA (guanine966-N2)-methyltransferase
MTEKLQIMGGVCRGMKLLAPPKSRTRPLKALAKKSLFDSLMYEITDALCLDLFAGSGSIGLEALSWGARGCLFVEADTDAFAVLKKNVDKIRRGVDNDEVLIRLAKGKAEDFLAVPSRLGPFDLVFLDPPYAAVDVAEKCLVRLRTVPGWVHPDSMVIYHCRKDTEFNHGGWGIIDRRIFGEAELVKLKASGI